MDSDWLFQKIRNTKDQIQTKKDKNWTKLHKNTEELKDYKTIEG